MPLRRASPEPSPRLRALLDSVDRRAPGDGERVHARSGRPVGALTSTSGRTVELADGSRAAGGSGAGDGSGAAAGHPAWLPERSWVLAARQPVPASAVPASARATSEAGRHRRPAPAPPALLMLPAALRGARLRVPRLATVGLLVIVVLAAVGFGVRVAWARAASAPHAVGSVGSGSPTAPAKASGASGAPGAPGSAVTAGSALTPGPGRAAFGPPTGGPNGGPTGTAGAAGATGTSTVTVHMVGQVVHPGVVTLPLGSRVTDAVDRAGGPRPDADLSAVNLARVLVDGEQLRVPKPGEAPAPVEGPGSPVGRGPVPPGAGADASGVGAASAPVNLNTAGLADLDQLPGVGPVLAQRILDWRTQHQRFASVDELGEVSGIGDKLLAQLRPKVVV